MPLVFGSELSFFNMVYNVKMSLGNHTYYNNKFFGRWAWAYDFEKYIFFPLRKKTVAFANLQPPKKILDVATGTGALAFEFAKAGHNVVGIDLSPKMLAQARKKLNPNIKLVFQEADGTALPFLGGYTTCPTK